MYAGLDERSVVSWYALQGGVTGSSGAVHFRMHLKKYD